MNPTLNTSSRRIIRLLVNDLRDPGRLVWLFAAAVIFGGLELLIMYKAQDQESINKPINILLLLILPFSLSFYSHWGLSLLHRRGRACDHSDITRLGRANSEQATLGIRPRSRHRCLLEQAEVTCGL